MTTDKIAVAMIVDDEGGRRAPSSVVEAVGACARVARASGSASAVELIIGATSAPSSLDEDHGLGGFDDVQIVELNPELGIAGKRNHLAARIAGEVLMFLDPGLYPAPTALAQLAAPFGDTGVGAADARRLPLEHPKGYDAITGDTGHASAGFLAVRRDAFERVEGFDATTFPSVGADVDLSWRIRAGGLRIVHMPSAVVVSHDPIERPAPAGDFPSALARLMIATKWARDDLAEHALRHFDYYGSVEQRRAARHFRALRAADQLPEPVERAAETAQFVDDAYARHRWEAR